MSIKAKSGLTKRSKELNKAIFEKIFVARLTKTGRHTFPQNDADAFNKFLWQTRSLNGYRFLNGAACRATKG